MQDRARIKTGKYDVLFHAVLLDQLQTFFFNAAGDDVVHRFRFYFNIYGDAVFAECQHVGQFGDARVFKLFIKPFAGVQLF